MALLAILNLYQSSWEKLSEKIWNGHFWPFQIYTSPFWEKLLEKFGMAILGHSEFVPVFLGKIVRKNSEQLFLAIPSLYPSFGKNCWKKFGMPLLAILNLYQSFWGKLSEKIWNCHFWPFQIYTNLFGKNCWKKFGTSIFVHSEFILVFLRNI